MEELWIRAAKEYGKAHGYQGRVGGWIYYPNGNPCCQGWATFMRTFRAKIRAWLVTSRTGFGSIEEVVQHKTYRPTLLVQRGRDWREFLIAEEYDAAQAQRGDPRRAYRGVNGYRVRFPADGVVHYARFAPRQTFCGLAFGQGARYIQVRETRDQVSCDACYASYMSTTNEMHAYYVRKQERKRLGSIGQQPVPLLEI